MITPSTGIVSPGRTRRRSPTLTASAGTICSFSGVIKRAFCGVRCTSFSMPARALATVSSSRRLPNCIMKATSPAAKSSPMMTEAIRARDTKRSAVISNFVMMPMKASVTIGTPQRMMATQAAEKGSGASKRLSKRAAPEIMRKAMSRFMPPSPRRYSRPSTSLLTKYFMTADRCGLPRFDLV